MNQPKANAAVSKTDQEILVYIVDDEPMLLELARVILEPMGYQVETFRDAEAALKAYSAAAKHPTLIITDFAMHKMTGLGLIEACRRIRPKQKVLLVSGTIDEEFVRSAASKPDIFLPKPYQAGQLANAVKTILAGK